MEMRISFAFAHPSPEAQAAKDVVVSFVGK